MGLDETGGGPTVSASFDEEADPASGADEGEGGFLDGVDSGFSEETGRGPMVAGSLGMGFVEGADWELAGSDSKLDAGFDAGTG